MSLILPNTIVNEQAVDAAPVQANFAMIRDFINNELLHRDGTRSVETRLEQPLDPIDGDHLANKRYVDALVPPGVVLDYTGLVAPLGKWALPHGQYVSKEENPTLYGMYEASSFPNYEQNSTQFKLPDLRGKFVVMYHEGGQTFSATPWATGGDKDAIIPVHSHAATGLTVAETGTHGHGIANGSKSLVADESSNYGLALGSASGFRYSQFTFAHSGNNTAHTVSGNTAPATGGAAVTDKNLPPFIVLTKIIRLG
jgi:microcystin-dependent protein